jgi:hypothetical protein
MENKNVGAKDNKNCSAPLKFIGEFLHFSAEPEDSRIPFIAVSVWASAMQSDFFRGTDFCLWKMNFQKCH